MVVNGEVVVQLDDALGLHLELLVGVLGPPLLDVAVAVVLASCGPRHRIITDTAMTHQREEGTCVAAPHIIFYTFLRRS